MSKQQPLGQPCALRRRAGAGSPGGRDGRRRKYRWSARRPAGEYRRGIGIDAI